ncbi:bifunctional UDP-N-acetylglucosamine diphosphorylase/glucosamine-1-phosphate N-acetyltransferase GlmU [Nitrosococcus wardiae]|uniref:Bifunctional protein GlmU n=1 Tax=Nitrosococcus wardiae TaxID=1814290 RepID=A0A4P7BXF9_9GAMM|nr:bifunctional UDP-N-acetylglucosamine diphosphorylase/glucosamine-1-phosphate N-acetyltransferase GlmU [Nitrosococcus wardiae]QBQ53800.1 UDP-N-acetylglucosamine diphosphorylase/glucosamine-1-phosphate N-acetyltransferase [Nitrosococcus wardiae]
MAVSVIILAAGQGTRMRSTLPKVLHRLAGRPLLSHVIAKARQLNPEQISVVYGHGGETVPEAIGATDIIWVRQESQLGTGHAVAQGLPHIKPDASLLILYGDVPLVEVQTLQSLLVIAEQGGIGLLTVELPNPTGYGRIIRDRLGKISKIVEEADTSPEQREIREVNTGIIAIEARYLGQLIPKLSNNNAQGEYYLTDIIEYAIAEDHRVETVSATDRVEVMGINDRGQLARLERAYQAREAARLMGEGVSLSDPARFDLRGELEVGQDINIDINVIFEGRVTLGDGVKIGPNCYIRNAALREGVEVLANCVIEDAIIDSHARIGPFARIRPETRLGEGVHVGNFVEIKKSTINQGSKVNHLSYIGDATVGKEVNIGAGTITCNYDGANKHPTIIEDHAFIGSNTQLVAPVKIGTGATIGAGTTITRDAPPGELTLSRVPQKTRSGWKRATKKKSD